MLRIKKSVWNDIIHSIGESIPERGGIIGTHNNIIVAFYFDPSYSSKGEYIPSVDLLNSVINEWEKEDIHFCGIVHSHEYNHNRPSLGDKIYAEKMYQNGKKKLYYPIVTIEDNIKISFYSYNHENNNFDIETVKIIE